MFRFVLRRSYSKQPQNIINLLHFHKPGEKVEVKGWVKSVRKHKENVFIDVNDGSTEQKLQVLVPHQYFPSDLSAGSSIRVDGVVTLSPKGQIELSAENVRVVGSCSVSEGYPIAPKKTVCPRVYKAVPPPAAKD
ncbi:hypothetical protein NQ315_007739 [Exocentrus adspersus]|uniref:OB domain-containing protein n=1 Tax=Exocentrus adspersus TaxID=1586481 RepID=A0AAV8W7S2_9CUCU|nr:hypothetical protein NQ315_007739 [Exocentrus adspersus]